MEKLAIAPKIGMVEDSAFPVEIAFTITPEDLKELSNVSEHYGCHSMVKWVAHKLKGFGLRDTYDEPWITQALYACKSIQPQVIQMLIEGIKSEYHWHHVPTFTVIPLDRCSRVQDAFYDGSPDDVPSTYTTLCNEIYEQFYNRAEFIRHIFIHMANKGMQFNFAFTLYLTESQYEQFEKLANSLK